MDLFRSFDFTFYKVEKEEGVCFFSIFFSSFNEGEG